tara:strand:- start:591 stop:1154 length:564 start_codon:yes stop_codon:yes gene_type:complete
MCGVAEAQLALAVVGTVAKHQNEKAIAKRNEAANRVTMGNVNEAYMNDLAKIDAEASRVDQAQSLERLKMRQELTKNQAYAVNAGFGNALKVMQDMSGSHDLAYGELLFDVEKDTMTLMNQEDDAYANLHRGYSNIRPVEQPSLLGSGLALAGHGLNYAASDNKWINRRKPRVDYSAVPSHPTKELM